MAVSVGFEPTARITTNNTLAGCRFKPLIQLTINLAEELRFELRDLLQSAVFKTAGLNHSPTLPISYRNTLRILYETETIHHGRNR